jgi:hypothetical protein
LLIAGCGQSESGSGADAPAEASTESSSGDDALLQELLASLDSARLVDADVGDAPGDFITTGSWLHITIDSDEGLEGARSYWDALLVAGAYRDAAEDASLPRLAGVTIGDARNPPTSAVVEGSNLPSMDSMLGRTLEEIDRAAASIGLARVAAEFPIVDFPGVALVYRTDDPEKFVLEHRYPAEELLGDLTAYAGTFVEIVDPTGAPVLASGFVARTGQGVGWVDPRFNLAPRGSQIPNLLESFEDSER